MIRMIFLLLWKMGLVAVWIVPKVGDDYPTEGLARNWCSRLGDTLVKKGARCFGPRLNKLGVFSNGEAIFERALP